MIVLILKARPTGRCFGSKSKRRQGSPCYPQSRFWSRGLNRMQKNANMHSTAGLWIATQLIEFSLISNDKRIIKGHPLE